MTLLDRLKHAWNAFNGNESSFPPFNEHATYGNRGSRIGVPTNFRNRFAAPIFNRIALDVAMTHFNHVKIDKKNDDLTVLDTGLNYCLTVEANMDQAAPTFLFDLAYSLLDEGEIAILPVDTSINPKVSGSYDIDTMRVAKIISKTNKSVFLQAYDENDGKYHDIWLPKNIVAVVESPLYYVINEQNSTLQRLLRKMSLIDSNDNLYSANRLDLIIQAPHAIRTPDQVAQAEGRILNIDKQLRTGNNGIAYIDGTERITQINRPANSQINETADLLKEEFYNQLGLTQSIFDGSATEAELKNYYNRTIDPIITFVVREMERKFLTKTGRTQGQAIEFYRNTLQFVSAEQLVSLGDAFRRNEIATSNEIRKLIGFKRSNEASADKLVNPNISDKNQGTAGMGSATKGTGESSREIQRLAKDVKKMNKRREGNE